MIHAPQVKIDSKYLQVEVYSKLLISQSKFSGTRYHYFEIQGVEMGDNPYFYFKLYSDMGGYFDDVLSVFGISKTDCISVISDIHIAVMQLHLQIHIFSNLSNVIFSLPKQPLKLRI